MLRLFALLLLVSIIIATTVINGFLLSTIHGSRIRHGRFSSSSQLLYKSEEQQQDSTTTRTEQHPWNDHPWNHRLSSQQQQQQQPASSHHVSSSTKSHNHHDMIRKKRQQRNNYKNYNNNYKRRRRSRIHRPDLFSLFDPRNNEDPMVHSKRTHGLQSIGNNRVLTSMLHSWANHRHLTFPNHQRDDIGDRCREVLNHVRYIQNEEENYHLSVNEFTYCVVMNAYAKRKQPKKAESLLNEINRQQQEQNSVKSDAILYSTVMKAWIQSNVKDAPEQCKRLFHEMKHHRNIQPDVVLYNTLINAYASKGRAREAQDILQKMLLTATNTTTTDDDNIIQPNTYSYNSVMNAWSKLSSYYDDAPDRCKQILSTMTRLAELSNNDDNNESLYPDVVSYNTVIHAYSIQGRAKEAEDVLCEMLKTTVKQEESSSRQPVVHPNVQSYTSVMNAWSKSNDTNAPTHCQRLLEEMKHYHDGLLCPNTVTYNTVMNCFAIRGRPREAEQILREMIRNLATNDDDDDDKEDVALVKPDVRSFSTVIKAWANTKTIIKDENNVHLQPEEECLRLLTEMYELATTKTTDNQRRRRYPFLTPDIVTCNIVMDALASRGRAQDAENVLQTMLEYNILQPNVISYNTVMNGWSKSNATNAPEQCLRLLEQMKKHQQVVRQATGKQQQKTQVVSIADGDNNLIVPDIITYNTLIDCYANRGRAQEAEEVLRDMISSKNDIKPTTYSYLRVMSAWSKTQDDDAPDHCKRLLKEMQQQKELLQQRSNNNKINPSYRQSLNHNNNDAAIPYNIVLNAYANNKRPNEAKNMLKEMLRNKIIPNATAFQTVMNSYCHLAKAKAPSNHNKNNQSHQEEVIEDHAPPEEQCKQLIMGMTRIAKTTKDTTLLPDIGMYVTLVDTYMSCGRTIEEVDNVLQETLQLLVSTSSWLPEDDNRRSVLRNDEAVVITISRVKKLWEKSNIKKEEEKLDQSLLVLTEMEEVAANDNKFMNDIFCLQTNGEGATINTSPAMSTAENLTITSEVS